MRAREQECVQEEQQRKPGNEQPRNPVPHAAAMPEASRVVPQLSIRHGGSLPNDVAPFGCCMPHSRRAARLLRVHTGGNAPCVTARRRSPSQKSLAKRLASRPGPRVDCACRGCDAVKPRLAREPEQRAAIGAAAVRGRPGSPMLNTRASPAAATRRSSSLTPLARRASAGRTPFPYKPVLTLDGQAAEEVMNSHEHRPRSALCQVHRSAGRLPSSLFGWRAKPMCFRCFGRGATCA